MKQHLPYVDEMKGFAILLVVMGHYFIPHTIERTNFPINTIIYSFHMSFFFFLSGYLLELTNDIKNRGGLRFIKKKSFSLLIPFLFWILIAPLFLNNPIPNYSIDEVINRLNFYKNPISYWFLGLLYLFMMTYAMRSKILSYLHKDGCLKAGITINCLTVLGLAGIGVILHEYQCIAYAIYLMSFFFGDLFYKSQTLQNLCTKKPVIGVCGILLCIIWKFYPLEANHDIVKSMINLIMYAISSISSCIVLFYLFTSVPYPFIIKRYFAEIGKMSLVIYVLPISLLPAGFIFPNWMPVTTISIIVLGISIVHTITSYVLGRILFEIPYLRFITFGKK